MSQTKKMLQAVDDVFDLLLAKLGCTDSSDAHLISHWQSEGVVGFRIYVRRKSDDKALIRFVHADGTVSL